MGTLGPKYILFGYMDPLGKECACTGRRGHYSSARFDVNGIPVSLNAGPRSAQLRLPCSYHVRLRWEFPKIGDPNIVP